ncbi:uncharacterized protein H6S33_008645 [Morchella sextelata]|uniref:uncharacterized protein n=1 Tax=Morchella sextelata TaxID=1174677 RepID=UPI001D049556|nr:uncharacterized protein H6S33_008645 [Morchella sextelata]KAH0602564.1 hypothetical protein H6S33_008645 [Morchella sextelata]
MADGGDLPPLPESPPYRTPSPRRPRRYTNSMDTPTAPQTGYEDVVRLLETVASATLGERNLTDTYEARIRDLEAENAELLKENEELLHLLNRDDRPATAQATKALAQVRTLKESLISDREGFSRREAGLTARVWGLEQAVTDSLRDLLQERRLREEVEWQVWPRGREEVECARCAAREEAGGGEGGGVGEEMLRSMEAVTVELEMRNEEMKQTQSAAEEELELASHEIERLQREVKALEMLKHHKEDTEAELDMLKDGMKRIERVAMMYGPLEDELGLLDAIDSWKLEFLAVSTKRKKRKKKEEKHGLG